MANGVCIPWTPEKETEFLQAVVDHGGNITAAARSINVSHSEVYYRKKIDPAFAAALSEAVATGMEVLESECRRRAFAGSDEPVFYQGGECGVVRRYSDTLAIFLLKGAMPDKYRERLSAEHSGPGGGPIRAEVVIYIPDNGRDADNGSANDDPDSATD